MRLLGAQRISRVPWFLDVFVTVVGISYWKHKTVNRTHRQKLVAPTGIIQNNITEMTSETHPSITSLTTSAAGFTQVALSATY